MRQAIVIYATGLASFVVLDGVWLGLMVPRLYKPAMGDLVAQPFQPLPAIAFYLIYGIGLAVFAIMPALSAGKLTTAFVYGALFGLVAYATYDLTNQATLRGWPAVITIVDLAWGTFGSALAASIAFLVLTRWFAA